MNEVLTTPEARPASLWSTSDIAAIRTGFIAMPTPIPSTTIVGSTSSQNVPSTGARANSARPIATRVMPTPIGRRGPSRITIRADDQSETGPVASHDPCGEPERERAHDQVRRQEREPDLQLVVAEHEAEVLRGEE